MIKNIFLVIPLVMLLACGSKVNSGDNITDKLNENSITLTAAQLKNAGIETMLLQHRAISSILKLNGRIEVPPQNIVSISVPMGGYLKSTKLLTGMHVNKGDVIATVEDQQYIQLQQDYLTAKAKISFLENEYLRQKELNESKASSDKMYQQAEAEYKSQKVLMSALAEKLKLAGIAINQLNENSITRSIQIHSPVNGYVSKVNVNIGKYVSPTDVLFELINPTDIHLALKVFEKDVNKLFIGQKLVAYTNNEPGKKHLCEILLIGKDLSADRNTEVHCHFHDYDKTLIPGTYMNAEIAISNKKSLVLPEDAVVRFENKQYVFIKTNEFQFEMTEIKTGITENGYTEIISTESENQKQYVRKGAYSLLMSLKNKSDE